MMTKRVVLFFLDGVGIGSADPDVNPLMQARLPVLRSLLGGRMFHKGLKSIRTRLAQLKPVNATLGVAGLPQSGTGQTAIFTGINAPKKIGRHFGPFPTTDLKPVIRDNNIFAVLLRAGKSVVFANTFPRQFFEFTKGGTRRLTVTTLSCMMSGVPLLTADDLKRNRGISADITRQRWQELGYPDLPEIAAEDAGSHLADLSREHDFTLFEYWLTDHAGHSQDMKVCIDVVERFDRFLGGFLEKVDLTETTALLISDHGNLEDITTKGHTRNPVPCLAFGRQRNRILASIKNLAHVTPAIVKLLTT
ncbi:MAG: alkaline phosphatase family protein [Bacteroidota bacterium]